MPHREFQIPAIPPEGQTEPITFDLMGRKFTCIDDVPIATKARIGAGLIRKIDLAPFIEGVIVDADMGAWHDVLSSKDPIVPDAVVEEIFWWLIEQYAERTGQQIAARLDDESNGG